MSDPGSSISLEMIGRMLIAMRSEIRELNDMRPLLMALVEQGRRTDRNISELKDDLELMLRAELMGSVGHFRTQLERQLEELSDRVSRLESK